MNSSRKNTKKSVRKKVRFAEHPSVRYREAILRNLKDRTGKTLAEWIQTVEKSGPTGQKACALWLKKAHKLGSTTAALIAAEAAGGRKESAPQKRLEGLFAGKRAGLRPLRDELLRLAMSLGNDVSVTPTKTMIPIRRRHVIAHIKPATQSRIDLGLALGRSPVPRRLFSTGGLEKGDRITHRIPIATLSDIDKDVAKWMRKAYELDA